MRNRNSFNYFILSILLHLSLFLLVIKFNYLELFFANSSDDPSPLYQLEEIDLNKIRTVGTKDGDLQFSEKIIFPQGQQIKKAKISMDDLKIFSQPNKSNAIPKTVDKLTGLYLSNSTNSIQYSEKYSPSVNVPQPAARDLLNRSSLNVVFTSPRGVEADELNTVEKKFYSFQKRTYKTYLSSFLSTYQKLFISKPYIQQILINESHSLSGKVLFDKLGNIISIKIIRWSVHDDVQMLFENTLENIKQLPNLPTELLNDSEELTIYFQLNINPKI